jgi:hypothetical protein
LNLGCATALAVSLRSSAGPEAIAILHAMSSTLFWEKKNLRNQRWEVSLERNGGRSLISFLLHPFRCDATLNSGEQAWIYGYHLLELGSYCHRLATGIFGLIDDWVDSNLPVFSRHVLSISPIYEVRPFGPMDATTRFFDWETMRGNHHVCSLITSFGGLLPKALSTYYYGINHDSSNADREPHESFIIVPTSVSGMIRVFLSSSPRRIGPVVPCSNPRTLMLI